MSGNVEGSSRTSASGSQDIPSGLRLCKELLKLQERWPHLLEGSVTCHLPENEINMRSTRHVTFLFSRLPVISTLLPPSPSDGDFEKVCSLLSSMTRGLRTVVRVKGQDTLPLAYIESGKIYLPRSTSDSS